MKNADRRNSGSRPMTVFGAAAPIVISALLAGCSDGYETISAQPYGTD